MQGFEHWHSSLGPNMSVATSEGKEGEEVPQGPWMKSHVLRLFTGVVFLPLSPAAFSAVLCITGSDGCSHHITTSSQQTIARGGEQLPRTEQAITSLLSYGLKIWRNQFISGPLDPSWALCSRTYFLICVCLGKMYVRCQNAQCEDTDLFPQYPLEAGQIRHRSVHMNTWELSERPVNIVWSGIGQG